MALRHKRTNPRMLQPFNLQTESLLFQTPQEIRNLIYDFYFFSTSLLHRNRVLRWLMNPDISPVHYGLPLLRTCRRVFYEVGDTWIGKVELQFEDLRTMLNALAPLISSKFSQIRHLRVTTLPLMQTWSGRNSYYRLGATLKLLSGLQLDTLTVNEDASAAYAPFAYITLDDLIERGQGWKKLHFISQDSRMLGYKSSIQPLFRMRQRQPQPEHWQRVLNQRDGSPEVGASVIIYRSIMPGVQSSVLNPSTREIFKQKVPESQQELLEFGEKVDQELMAKEQIEKSLLIIARRGENINYKQKEFPPITEEDIRADFPGKRWAEIREAEDRFDPFPGSMRAGRPLYDDDSDATL